MSRRARVGRAERVVRGGPGAGWGPQLWAGVLLVVAAAAFAPAYAGSLGPVPVVLLLSVVAVAVPMTLLAVARRVGISAKVAAAATAVLLLTGALLVLRRVPAPDVALPAWRSSAGLDLIGPLVDAVPRLLSAQRPAPLSAVLVAPTLLLVGLVAVVVSALLARPRSALLAPVVGASALYVTGSTLTAGAGDRGGGLALVLVLLVVAGWVLLARTAPARVEATGVRSGSGGRRALLRPGAGALPVAAALVAVSAVTLVAGGVSRADAFEPRDLVTTPRLPLDVTSPLPDLAVWGDQTDLELLRLTGSLPARVSIAVLPDFDGADWRSTSDFVPLGTVARPSMAPGARRGAMDATVTVTGLRGSFLPSAGQPSAISLDDAAWDPETGTLVTPAGLSEGLTYQVVSTVDTPSDAELATASVPSGVAAQRYLELPEVPVDLVAWAQQGTAQARGRLEQAIALEELVRSTNLLDPLAPTGSSYARLQDFLFAPAGTPGAHRGTSEQFAAAFAVLGRAINLPTRLVVGFDVPEQVDGVAVVTGGDAKAWAEVYFSGWGWVAFDPTPEPDGSASDPVRQEVLDAMADEEAELVPVPPAAVDPDADASVAAAPESTSRLGVAAVVLAGVLLLVVAVLLVLLLLRLRRRQRHRRSGVVGAWSEAVDALVLVGARPSADRSADDLARVLAERSHRPSEAALLAESAQRASYAPDPGAASSVDGSWAVSRDLVAAVRAASSRRRRLLWWVDPTVLRRQR